MATRPKPDTRVTSKPKIGSCPIDLGNRICIYGRGGKTSLSRALGDQTGLPVIELDAIFWGGIGQLRVVARIYTGFVHEIVRKIVGIETEDGFRKFFRRCVDGFEDFVLAISPGHCDASQF